MEFHRAWALVVLAVLVVAVVAGGLALGRREWDRRYATYLRVCSGVIGIQALVGIVLLLAGQRPGRGLHFLFGPAVLVALPVAERVAARHQGRRRASVRLGGAAVALVFALASFVTGGGA
ncbi:MAG: hypothetical protein NVSMB29_17630 [Candidatus Dormibacteria bacterium]